MSVGLVILTAAQSACMYCAAGREGRKGGGRKRPGQRWK